MYKTLSAVKTIETIQLLKQRIEERFPNSNLGRVCDELNKIAVASKRRSEWIARPIMSLRIAVAALVTFSLCVVVYSLYFMSTVTWSDVNASEMMQAADASMETLFFTGAVIFFLITAEMRMKRTRALDAVHELRVIAHVIDMHQLTKNPARIINKGTATASSPGNDMTVFELIRYLDYCTEMLSLTGKVAALYAQTFRDQVLLTAVNDVESLTTGLSQKIWQKIMILHKFDESRSDVLN